MNRVTADAPEGTVLFIVGMRINQLWAIHRWLPVASAMPRMLTELDKHRELGMVGTPRTLVSGRLIVVQQYWQSYDALEGYARNTDHKHLAAWRAFNTAARDNDAVGIFHETYLIGPGTHESIYVNVPRPILLADAVGQSDIASGRRTSRQRLKDVASAAAAPSQS